MQLFSEPEKLADIIRHQYIVEKYDPEMIQQMSNLLTDPKNVNIYIRSKSFDTKPELTPIEDRWYKTKYGKEHFNPALLQKINHP